MMNGRKNAVSEKLRQRIFTLIELLVGTACFPGCFRQKYEV